MRMRLIVGRNSSHVESETMEKFKKAKSGEIAKLLSNKTDDAKATLFYHYLPILERRINCSAEKRKLEFSEEEKKDLVSEASVRMLGRINSAKKRMTLASAIYGISDRVVDNLAESRKKDAEFARKAISPDAVDPLESVSKDELASTVKKLSGKLKPRQREVLGIRLGIDYIIPEGIRKNIPENPTLRQVEKIIDVSYEGVRQAEMRGIRILRHYTNRKQLEPFY